MQQTVTKIAIDFKYCEGKCYKKGFRHVSQQYWCQLCKKYQKRFYKYKAYEVSDVTISDFVKEGVGIRSTSRLLKISQGTVISRIKKIASSIS